MARTTVFIVGAPRSGTTYLQNLLGAHPLVATSQETDLFDHYIASWRDHWHRQLPDSADEWQRQRHKGLPAILTEHQFDSILGGVVDRVHAETMALKAGASVLLEKVPAYGRHGQLILRYVPDARFIHLIRDGRDVTCSIVRAARGWGQDWAPASAKDAAALWRDFVQASRGIAGLTEQYTEVRYEELCSDSGHEALHQLFAFCGIDATTVECEQIVASGTPSLVWGGEVARRRTSAPEEPAGFAGEGGVGAWTRDLDPVARVLVQQEAGVLLTELGYGTKDWINLRWRDRLPTAVRILVRRQVERIHYRMPRRAEHAAR